MQGKTCTKCGEFKELSAFNKGGGKFGKRSECRECQRKYKKKWAEANPEYNKQWYYDNVEHKREYNKQWYQDNTEHVKEYSKEYNKNNRERIREYKKQWKKNNKDKVAAHDANRRAMKHALPYSTSSELWLDVIMEYDGKCAVTGKDRFDLEHMIPISIGWGGSLKNNIYPMDKKLNGQKSAKNPFKFLKQLKGQQRTNFEKVLHNLAKENGLTYKEYKKFVNWCFANPRTLEEVLEDNKLGLTQVELWKLRANLSN